MKQENNAGKAERGQVMILTAMILPILAGIAALGVDAGYIYSQQQIAQGAVDAAAQAGAVSLAKGYSSSTAISDAKAYLTKNGFTTSNSTIQVNIPPLSPPASKSYSSNYVQVIVTVNKAPFLSKVVGVTGLSATATAVAGITSSGTYPCGLCVMDPSASQAFYMNGSGNFDVSAGIGVDSSSSTASYFYGAANVNTGTTGFNIVGGMSNQGAFNFSPTPTTGASTFPDPLANYPLVSQGGLTNYGAVSYGTGTQTINPGLYSSLTLSGAGNLTMNPGLYVFTGAFSVSGAWNITGNGVTLYFGCSSYPTACSSSGQSGGSLSLNGAGNMTFSAPTSGSTQGMLVFFDRHNTSNLALTGASNTTISGTFYARSSSITLNGAGNGIDSLIVVDKAQITGAVNLNIASSTSKNVVIGSDSLVE